MIKQIVIAISAVLLLSPAAIAQVPCPNGNCYRLPAYAQQPQILYVPQIQYQRYQYQGSYVVPRATYFGNRFFGPRIYQYYVPQVTEQRNDTAK